MYSFSVLQRQNKFMHYRFYFVQIAAFRTLNGYDQSLLRQHHRQLSIGTVCAVGILIRISPKLVAITTNPDIVSGIRCFDLLCGCFFDPCRIYQLLSSPFSIHQIYLTDLKHIGKRHEHAAATDRMSLRTVFPDRKALSEGFKKALIQIL